MSRNWLKIGEDGLTIPHFISTDLHTVYYLRRYSIKDGLKPWDCGEDERIIYNFKKPKTVTGIQKRFKNKAVEIFTKDLGAFFKRTNSELSICATWMPGSKSPDSELYDKSLETVVMKACHKIDHMSGKFIFYQIENRTPMHEYPQKGWTRNPDVLKKGWELVDNVNIDKFDILFIVDDMLTAGTSTSASNTFIRENLNDEILIINICWARRIWGEVETIKSSLTPLF
ncbi:MAG: hypothetical protein WDZ80_04235 [Candidatus Paceibacterota bacterium]